MIGFDDSESTDGGTLRLTGDHQPAPAAIRSGDLRIVFPYRDGNR